MPGDESKNTRHPFVFALGALMVLSAALLLHYRLQLGFVSDDWSFILGRRGGGIGDFLEPHNEHIVVIPFAIYKLSLSLFGMGTDIPIQIASVSVFLLSVALLFIYLREYVGEAISMIGCSVVLFLGIAYADLLLAFQMSFSLSMASGLGALIMLRRNDDFGDRSACALLLVSILSTSMGLAFIVGCAIDLILRRDRVLGRAYVVLVPLVVYALWWLGWGRTAESSLSIENAVDAPAYVYGAYRTAVSGLTGAFRVSGSWLTHVVAIVALAGTSAWLVKQRRLPRPLLVALAIALVFWGLAALNTGLGREFDTSRYQFPGVVFLLMILAGAFEGIRPRPRVILVLAAVAALAIVANLQPLRQGFDELKLDADYGYATLTALDLSKESVDPDQEFLLGSLSRYRAAEYFAAEDEYGSLAWSAGQIAQESADARGRIDQARLEASPVESGSARLPATGCRTIQASASDAGTVTLSGNSVYLRPENDVAVTAGRFLEGAGLGVLEVPGGETSRMTIPPDESDVPWRIGFVGDGPVRVCQ